MGINVRLLLLKQAARNKANGLKNEIASTQRLVARSVLLVERLARELENRRPTPSELTAAAKFDLRVKAIAMSGHALDPVMLEPERHGFKGVLTKPFEIEQLQEVLSRVMGGSTASKHEP